MAVSNFSKARKIPTKVTTRKSAPVTTNFAKGIYTYKANDAMDLDEVHLAQNARFDRIGEYKTRLGLHAFTSPIGLTSEGSLDGYYDRINFTPDLVVPLNDSGSTDRLYSVSFDILATDPDDYFVLKAICRRSDTKEVLGVSCCEIRGDWVRRYGTFTFINGVNLFGFHDREIVFEPQDGKWHDCTIKVEPNTTTVKFVQRGVSSFTSIISMFETNVEGVQRNILFACSAASGAALYRVPLEIPEPDGGIWPQGTPQLVRTLPSGVRNVRFSQDGNVIRYADGVEGPRMIDPNNNWADTAIPTVDLVTGTDLNIKVSNIMTGPQDNIIYFDADTNTQAVWTYPYGYIHNNTPINSYDKFDRDFRQNFPAIKTGDPLTAMFNLGGTVYFLTRYHKYYLYMQTADTFRPYTSMAQHGTFSQESCVCDLNYAYYACDDGIYRFDGTSEVSITKDSIQSTYDAIESKKNIELQLYNNRLYVFYYSRAANTECCLVYNINLELWESFDTNIPVSSSIRNDFANRFLCGSSRFGQILLYEGLLSETEYRPAGESPDTKGVASDRDYSDLGAPINFDLETSYLHFGTPSQLHRIIKWRPEFCTTDHEYAVKCGYALDFTDNVKYAFSIDLKNNRPINEHYVWDNPPSYGSLITPTKLTTIPQVNGQFYRCQIRYQLHGAFTPVSFKAHTLSVETQRLR